MFRKKTKSPLSMAKMKYFDQSEGVKFSLHNKHFCIILPPGADRFDEKVEFIKTMTGKWWSKEKKRWYVPVDCFRQVFRYCLEFEVRVTREAKEKLVFCFQSAVRNEQVV